jgi:F420-0:gamma-glutamyl ligase-like protein
LMRGIKAAAQGRMSEALTAVRKLKGKISPEVEQELMQTMRSAGSGGNMAHMADGRKVERSSLFDHVTGQLKGLGDRLGVDKMVDWIDRQVDGLLHPMQGPQQDYVPVEGPMGKSAEKTAEENVKDARALQIKTQARGSRKPHVVEQYANAGAVKPFIETKVDPNNLPTGYLYGKIPTGKDALGREIYREVVYMPKPGKTTVPLVVENGRITLGKEGEYRIVEKAVYDANVVTTPGQAGKLLGGKSQIHHIFADNMLRNTPFGQQALRLGAVNPDGSLNLIELANSTQNLDAARKAYPNVKFSDFIHNTQHPKFDGLMQDVLDGVIKEVREAKGLSRMKNENYISQMTKDEMKAIWDESLSRMRRGLMGEDTELYDELQKITRPKKGSLAQGEPQDDTQVA